MKARYLDALDDLRWVVKCLVGCLAGSVVIMLGLIIGWHTATTHIRVMVPPTIPSSGLNLPANAIPKSSVYAFAYTMWQQLNTWPSDGKSDAAKRIEQLSPFLTPRFKNQLIDHFKAAQSTGELQGRVRSAEGVNGTAFNVHSVEPLSNNSWAVTLPFRITERLNESTEDKGPTKTSMPVKDVAITYVIRVVRYDANASKNPWGLALDGYVVPPKREKTYV